MNRACKHKEDSVIQDNQKRSDKQDDDVQDASHDIQNAVFYCISVFITKLSPSPSLSWAELVIF